MSGYIFAINKEHWDSFLENNLKYGVFSPLTVQYDDANHLSPTKRKMLCKTLCTIYGDLITMKENDNIYFLSNRKIYGIGKATKIGIDCKYDNYQNASALLPTDEYHCSKLVYENYLNRWLILFKPAPFFFKKGVDMDDVLKYKPNSFKMLRAFQNRSFIKVDDEENRALREFISLNNEQFYNDIDSNTYNYNDTIHRDLQDTDLSNYLMNIENAAMFDDNFKYVNSEMFIESLFMQKVIRKDINIIGKWDYLTHQLIASPFKPINYVDWIDIFGYRFSTYYKYEPKLISKYLLIETKKVKINKAAIEQTMQYIDWICKEYASNNYSLIDAYIICPGTVRNINEIISSVCERSFIIESHPAKPSKWNNIKIIVYSFNRALRTFDFNVLY